MNKQEFETKMKAYQNEFNQLFDRINKDVNKFADENPTVTTYDMNTTEHFVDDICETGAWIKDRINNKIGKRDSLKKKIRKALGFTHP